MPPAEPLPALVARFLAHAADQRRLSPHTLRAYRLTLDAFGDFLIGHLGRPVLAADLAGLALADLRAFLAWRRASTDAPATLAPATLARDVSALKGLIAWARRHAGIDCAAAALLRAPRQPRRLPRPVAPADILAVANVAGAAQDWQARRDVAVLLLLYGAGLRVGEAVALDGSVLPLGETLAVTGKRCKTRIVPLLPVVRAAVADYLALCPWPAAAGAPLFRGARGGRLNANAIRAAMQAARVGLGLPDRATPHALRHSFATHLLAGGADLRQLQELLGHASLASTQIYTAVDAAQLLDAWANAHPRAG